MPYTRRQLVLLLVLLGLVAAGLGIGRWRRGHPDLVERLESIDRVAPVAAVTAAPRGEARVRPHEGAAIRQDTAAARAAPRRAAPRKQPADAAPLDVNRATAAELARLPGLGPALAERIVQAREASGAFASVDDLRRVRGVGRARLDRLRPLVRVEE
jgi:competence ComEA-like helix-hairpin-helix protein